MNQKQIEKAIRLTLIEMLKEQHIVLPVVAAFPFASAGRVDAGIYFFLINRTKNGWQARHYENNIDETALINTESQINEYMFQFQSFVEDNGLDDSALLAEDVLVIVRGILQSIKFTELMKAQEIGVQRATDIITPTFINDFGQYEHNPNFTVIFSNIRTLDIETPKVIDIQADINFL